MRFALLFLIIIFSKNLYSQKSSDGNIKIGHRFTLEIEVNNGSVTGYKVISSEAFNTEIELSDMGILFDEKINANHIQGIFAQGKFGKSTSTMLVLKSGISEALNYDLRIKLPKKSRFEKTSASVIFKGVPSIEIWPYPVEAMKIETFSIEQFNEKEEMNFNVRIDSTCIKNPGSNIENGEKTFITHLGTVVTKFQKPKEFPLSEMLDFEKSIQSEDVSLGHKWELSSGIYPNEKSYDFGNPLTFRRPECPYFEGKVNYFYTVGENSVKVISFNWEMFKESNFGSSNKIDPQEMRNAFESKYSFIRDEVSKVLGEPLDIKKEKDSGRIDTKWESATGVKGYLFMFEKYNEIRLYIYNL